jgi:nitroreductase/YHS domain-containing protein
MTAVTAIDSVCEMEVGTATAAWTSDYRGVTYYFCARACKTAFDRDPGRYLARARHTVGGPPVIPAAADEPAEPAITMPVDVAIKTRRSIARFKDAPVPRELVERLLDSAVWAPNHHLTEPWEFHVMLGDEAKRAFAERRVKFRRTLFKNPDAPETRKALDKVYADTVAVPVIIAVTTTSSDDPDLRDDDYGATMCAIQNMLLTAVGLGLGVYLRTGGFIHDRLLLDWLNVPAGRRVAAIL